MKNLVFTVALLLLCGACSTLQVNTDYNPAYDFTQLKTYAWIDDGKAVAGDTRINNDLISGRVRSAVEENLAIRGFVKTESSSADFRVSWHGTITKKLQVETIDHFYSPYGYGPLYRDIYLDDPMQTSMIREYEVGTLIVDILDPVHHKLVWRGSGSEHLSSDPDPETSTRKINEAVTAILKDFPPVKKY